MPEPAGSPRRRFAWIALAVYALLLATSTIWVASRPGGQADASDERLRLPVMTADGPMGNGSMRLRVHDWGAARPGTPAVVLLHGSPGDGAGFGLLAPELARGGYHVLAPDLPGFGDSDKDLPDLSARAHAHAVLAMLDAMGIERAHVVGWSNGGAVALWLAELSPDRTASLTLMASVGDQRTEGSGSYSFEHSKYKLGLAAFALARWLVPHFGLLDRNDVAWLRNFDDSDQRPLTAIMRTTRVPTLILHGRHDFLTPAWGAE
ncbi:MAG: alpha/beta fold hydrolase, partial [Salinibacterium sp.]|nr:alpha/beta fold hydrolase [Salinibacterium sp.]